MVLLVESVVEPRWNQWSNLGYPSWYLIATSRPYDCDRRSLLNHKVVCHLRVVLHDMLQLQQQREGITMINIHSLDGIADIEDVRDDEPGVYYLVSRIVELAAGLYHPFNDDDFHDVLHPADGLKTIRDLVVGSHTVPDDILDLPLDDVHVDHLVRVVGDLSSDVDGMAIVELGDRRYSKAIHGYYALDCWSF